MSELLDIPVNELHPHPDNPRLRMRDDVVEQIAAEIRRHGFGREHALLVWVTYRTMPGVTRSAPTYEHYTIVSGHHRYEAAKREGLETVPCWVREMDSDEAFMLLVLENTQGELSPLEIGMHALTAVPLAEGGRGKRGGLSEYAQRLGRTGEYIGQLRAAAAVVAETPNSSLDFIGDRAKHLYEISKAPEQSWSALVNLLIAHDWTVADTKRKVDEVKRFDIPAEHAEWLPLADVIAAYLAHGRPTSSAVAKLVSSVDGILEHIGRDGTPADAEAFRAWLVDNSGGDSWDHRKISRYYADLIVAWADRDADIADGRLRIYDCRASDLAQHVEPGSADLIFTDPPYPTEFIDCWTELGELAAQVLKPGGLLVAYSGQYTMPDALDRLRKAGLSWYWMYAVVHDGAFFRMNATHVQCGWKPLLVMRNGPAELPNWHKDFATYLTDGHREKDGHQWQQAEAEAAYWISELSKPDDLIVDPFVGSGTTALVCQQLGRRFIGCDIDEAIAERAREKVRSHDGAMA